MSFYDADIVVDVLLSYEWLGEFDVEVHGRHHGIVFNQPHGTGPVWVAGLASPVMPSRSKGGVNMITEIDPDMTESGINAISQCEEYTMRWPYFREITNRFGLEPQRDCFATQENKRCALFFSAQEDALQQEWGEGEILWLNPPWRLWPEAAAKLLQAKCAAIAICPAWSKEWVQKLVCAANSRIYFEQGARMFEKNGVPVPNTLWGMWALRFNKGFRRSSDRTRVYSECIFIPRWKPIKGMGSEKSEKSGIIAPRGQVRRGCVKV